MNLDEYQAVVTKTSNYGHTTLDDYKLAVALAGEVGEFCNKLKKAREPEVLLDELGDVLWYATALIHQFGGSLGEVMEQNAEKVLRRQQEGTTYNAKG